MAERIIIPRMGQTMTEGVVSRWYVQDGDNVNSGDNIYELEYDKASATITAKTSGIVRLLCGEGDTVPLGNAVAVILGDNETLESVNIEGEHAVANSAKDKNIVKSEKVNDNLKDSETKYNGLLASPMARKLAKDAGIDLKNISGTGKNGVIKACDVEKLMTVVHDCKECSKCGNEILITPLARKIARDNNINIEDVKPADGKRIYKNDILGFVPNKKAGRREKLSGMRKVIAERMSRSYFTYPTVTLNTDADMSNLMKFREQLNAKLAPKNIKLSVTDLLVKIVAKALSEHEIINASLEDDEIVYHEEINVGVAVAVDNGLVVPVIKNADELYLEEIGMETKRLIGLSKQGRLSGDDMNGGTFSITNLGMAGIDSFNPIINYPQSAILGIGRTVKKPVVIDDNIVIRPIMSLSLTHDHRVIDGMPAADFLKTIVSCVENPWMLYMD